MTAPAEETPPRQRKRTRIYGSFACDFPDCSKSFTRHDHLLRHKRNHNPQNRLPCTWPGCQLMFNRSDVRERHMKRHSQSLPYNKESLPYDKQNIPYDKQSLSYNNTSLASTKHPDIIKENQTNLQNTNAGRTVTTNGTGINSQINTMSSQDVHSSNNGVPGILPYTGKNLSPSDLIEWLFHDDTSHDGSHDGSHDTHDGPVFSHHSPIDFRQSFDFPTGVSPMSLLESMFAVSPDFPHSNTRRSIDTNVRDRLVALVPALNTNPDFGVPQIERYLDIYWLIFHPQYPILHRPSFDNTTAPPLLLLAMIMTGAGLSACTGMPEPLLENPHRLADDIAGPLRWLIFASPACMPPATVWVIQSLLLLETYEITSTSRALHERAYLHHGTKVQLLRRSPILGGDPLKDDVDDEAYPNHVWKKWIEVESMKRATLMAFYLDTVNATVYGHVIILYAHQIKLSLPCEDDLWEFDNTKQKPDSLVSEKPPKFLVALRKLLHRQKVKTSAFGRKILLAGLLTIMFQMQQKDLQLSFLEWNQMKDSWNETISLAIDVWRTDICSKGCCNTENSLRFSEEDKQRLPPMLRIDDKRCKFSLYHISQIYMRITHYDYIIYAGAPSRMNVIAGTSAYAVVEKRVSNWAKSANGRISVVHAYLFLCEMLLSPDNEDITYSYDPNLDPFLHRKNILVSAVLVVFAYTFVLEGPENDIYDSITGDYYPDKEDGYAYLKRIRRELSSKVTRFHTNSASTSSQFHENIKLFANAIPTIPNKNHTVGLLKIFSKTFQNCRWEVGIEYGKLFQNCMARGLGRKKITCDDMYTGNTTQTK
ncbi:C2H2 zinc finger protein Ribonuc_L-PSP Endoribonuclease L-PSP [Yamadazyma tenuis ATCC 10573]|uniref:C2H2 zinc finger protein Ribonuc_L-PSP Endoribonuclease L-PSP n=1 Tax=Candida tenuis (strain ATCC 10573 / BCRC 21748 / CBS 615 / JCM 9827 / NBRC 10315 / NRRL Y-1498 / VKM Y-70) TaxID=590646 RepID=G3AWD1_CANTC|nr:C2H2 zinc finger protein Ribonuc_L-PSP Endoribonuclease L-PSP [Yamadazyma tenuis ATCC 10573]EGV66512.1 C2H2 zinc finger protein Ribonuc_L-PSP Endoribonuclease L-PSP [Yamadazyma tenuis ATCC 10573]